MKKLIFLGSYPPPYGGIASHLYVLLPELVKRGYEVVSITPSTKSVVKSDGRMRNRYVNIRRYFAGNCLRIVADMVRHVGMRCDLSLREYARSTTLAEIIRDISESENADVLFVYSIDYGYAIPLLKKMLGERCRIALMIFGAFYREPENYVRHARYIKSVFDASDVIMSSSEHCARSVERVFGYNHSVRTVYIGVDENEYSPLRVRKSVRDELNLPERAVVAMFFGRMIRHMGMDFVMRCAPRILQLDEHVHLLIAGAYGDMSTEVRMLEKNESRVRCCIDVPSGRKPDYYAACDILIAPTMDRQACMGVAIKEAMASGKPVVASTSGGIPEAVRDGVNGFLVPIRNGEVDEDVFIDRLRMLVADAELRKTMGQKGRELTIRMFSNAETTKRYLDIIKGFALSA